MEVLVIVVGGLFVVFRVLAVGGSNIGGGGCRCPILPIIYTWISRECAEVENGALKEVCHAADGG